MRTFLCGCGNRLHFENTLCLACGAAVVYDPVGDRFEKLGEDRAPQPCRQRDLIGCNWSGLAAEEPSLCASCILTTKIPSLDDARNVVRLAATENAKRRMLRTLVSMRLWNPGGPFPEGVHPLRFEFLEPVEGGPVVTTGHEEGVITLNILEADEVQREINRENLGEPYRTLLGHFRHEVGHYYWDSLIQNRAPIDEFRSRFGDERSDYAAAMSRHYETGPPPGWDEHHISAYATMHPWEDWAETWAHFMHRFDTLETARDTGVAKGRAVAMMDPRAFIGIAGANRRDARAFLLESSTWHNTILVANELSRSMGQPDVYPFVPGVEAMQKLFFVQRVAMGRMG